MEGLDDDDLESWAQAIEAKLPDDDDDIQGLAATDKARVEREKSRAKAKKVRAAKGNVIHMASAKPVVEKATKKDA